VAHRSSVLNFKKRIQNRNKKMKIDLQLKKKLKLAPKTCFIQGFGSYFLEIENEVDYSIFNISDWG
jgi:hypothetical protein